MNSWPFFIFMIVPFAIGIPVIIMTIKRVDKGLLKNFLLMLGASLTGFPIFIFFHNILYGVFIYFFGNDFWKGGDEPIFFILALFICPIGFLVGLVGSLVIIVRKSKLRFY